MTTDDGHLSTTLADSGRQQKSREKDRVDLKQGTSKLIPVRHTVSQQVFLKCFFPLQASKKRVVQTLKSLLNNNKETLVIT